MNDDQATTAEPTPEPARTPTLSGPEEAINLAPLLSRADKDLGKKLAGKVIDDYAADVSSRRARMKKLAQFERLYAAIVKAKSFPFQNAANVSLPFLAYPSLQTQARLFDMVIPPNGKILVCSPTNEEDVHRAALAEKFGNSYIRHEMDNFESSMDETLLQVVKAGSAFRRTYWDLYEEKVVSDYIPMSDMVVAYKQKSTDPSMRDVPRYTLVLRPTIYDLQEYADRGIYSNVDGISAGDGEDDGKGDDEVRKIVEKEDGVSPSNEGSDEDKPRMVLEQYRRHYKMPNKPGLHPSFDGKTHAVIVTVDARSKRLLRLVVREEDDPKDALRFEKQNAAFMAYQSAADAHEAMVTQMADAATIAAKRGLPPDMTELPGSPTPQLPEPPVPPDDLVDEAGQVMPPKPARRRQISFFTHYKCFPGEGFYGHGFGDFIAPLNEAANTLLNQHIDGVTLRNARPGFISSQLRGPKGAVSVQPGELQIVDAPMGAIKDGIAWLDPPMSDPSTMQIIELLSDLVDKFGGADILSGNAPGSNQTARGMIILNEQAMAAISVLSRRIKIAEKHEIDKIWRLWGVFLPDEEIQASIVDENGVPGTIPISRSLFRPDARVMPAGDVRMRWQKVEEASSLYAMGAQNPIIAQSRPAMQSLTEDLLRAQDAQKIIPMIQPPPPEPPPPPVPHWQEDAGFLRGQDHAVHPMDNDQAHIDGHQAFSSSPAGVLLDKNGRDMLERHIRMHAANRLEKAGNDVATTLAGLPPVGAGNGGLAGPGVPPAVDSGASGQGPPAMA